MIVLYNVWAEDAPERPIHMMIQGPASEAARHFAEWHLDHLDAKRVCVEDAGVVRTFDVVVEQHPVWVAREVQRG